MAESSIFWTTDGTGDGTDTGYTPTQLFEFVRMAAVSGNSNSGGVAANYLNELEVTGTSTPVSVDTGAAVVYGIPYFNSAAVEVAIPTPSGDTRIDYIVLRASWAAQTVRVTRIAGDEGGAAPALTQTPSTTWDVPLATASITTGGDITVTDAREWLLGTMSEQNAGAVAITGGTMGTVAITGGTITSPTIVNGTMGTATITGGTVASAAITSPTISNGTMGTATITGGTITSAAIVNGTMGTATITGGTVASAAITSPTISNGTMGTATVTGGTIVSAYINKPSGFIRAIEDITISATAASGTVNFDVNTQSVLYYTDNASGNWTINIRGDAGTSLDSIMATGESMTIAFLATQSDPAYYNDAILVDGASETNRWQGGAAPSAGNVDSIDTYVYTVVKTGSEAFTIFASQTGFA